MQFGDLFNYFYRMHHLLSCIITFLVSSITMAQSTSPYFKASGHTPEWTVEISDETISFKSEGTDFPKLSFAHVIPDKIREAKRKVYLVRNDEVETEVVLTENLCTGASANELFPYSVQVFIRRHGEEIPRIFSGCGLYVPDHQLQGKWIIEKVRNDTIPSFLFADKVPYIFLGANEAYWSAFAGCNGISGRLYFEKGLLRFTDFVIPKETCDKMSVEKSIINALQFTTEYKFVDGKLILGNPSHSTFVLRKANI